MLLLIKQNNQIPPDATFITPHSTAQHSSLVWSEPIFDHCHSSGTRDTVFHTDQSSESTGILFIISDSLQLIDCSVDKYFNWVMMISVLMWLVQLISTIPLFQHVPPHAATSQQMSSFHQHHEETHCLQTIITPDWETEAGSYQFNKTRQWVDSIINEAHNKQLSKLKFDPC